VIAFLLPGQGSQRSGLLEESARIFDAADLFASASDILGFDVMHEDDEAALRHTAVVQRNIFLAGVAGARALERAGIHTAAVAGHSIGAFAAATLAGALSFANALELVDVRGKAMARAFGPGYGMGAILGATERQAMAITKLASIRDAAYVAVVNARDQIVVSGTTLAVGRALEIARERGARDVRLLRVDVPSHTPFMRPVRDELAAAFARVKLHRTSIPIAANVDGRALFSGEDVARDLVESVARTVRWFDATQMLHERGVDCFIETFPGDTLRALVTAALPDVTAISLERTTIASAAYLARHHL
jgi:malonate decarboxylase epsilon subunit